MNNSGLFEGRIVSNPVFFPVTSTPSGGTVVVLKLACKRNFAGKGSKERVVYLAGVQKMLVRRYVDERKDDLPALFIGKGSERLTPGGIRRILTKISKQSGVEGVHPHRFRQRLSFISTSTTRMCSMTTCDTDEGQGTGK